MKGFVSYPDGSIAESGTEIRIVDLDLGTVYDVKTGGKDWPYENFYLRSLTCNFGTDRIEVSYFSGEETIKKQFVYDRFPYEVNLTIPFRQEDEPTSKENQSGSGGGGGGGGSSTNDKQDSYDFGAIIDQSEINKILLDSKFRLYIINDTRNIIMIVGTVEYIGKDSIKISFNTLDEDVVLKLYEPKDLDLDNDGIADTRALVVELKKNEAYARFDRIIPNQDIPEEAGDDEDVSEEPQHEESPSQVPSKNKEYALMALGTFLMILLILITYIDIKERRKRA